MLVCCGPAALQLVMCVLVCVATLPLHACHIHLRAVLMLPGWCGGIAYWVCNAAGFFDYLCSFASLTLLAI